MELLAQTYKTLIEIKKNISEEFSGIGLVAYDQSVFSPSNHCDLRPSVKCPNYSIFDHNICKYLLEISDHRNTLHDGFHFINQQGVLTHVAQYFVPSIVNGFYPDQNHGVRLFSSKCGSTIKGVLFIASICSNGDIYVYESGKQVDLNSLLLEVRV